MFYDNLLKLCAERNVSPSGVAKKIGLSNAAATGWKNGKKPSSLTLEKLSSYLGVSIEELVKETPTGQMAGGLTKEDIDLLLQIKSAPESKKKAILELLKGWDEK